jgi:hypothetical protein
MLKGAAGLAAGLGSLALAGDKAFLPGRRTGSPGGTDPKPLPDIQFDIRDYIGKARKFDDGGGEVLAQLPPVHSMFTTAKLHRTPARADQARLAEALDEIEAAYPFAADGLLTFVSYGLPYFGRLPRGLVAEMMPRLRTDHARWALEEAVPGPTDVSPLNPGITKASFNNPVQIEQNDMLITIRTDNAGYLRDVLAWLGGSNSLRGRRVRSPALFNGLATVTSSRSQFVQIGLPAKIAATVGVPYAGRINPNSPMWMGFLDQQVDGSGPAAICTFAGNESARMTTARHGDYFDNGSIQHLSHIIEDLDQFYLGSSESKHGQTYLERVQYMFRSNPPPSHGFKDQFARGGGPACLDTRFNGILDAQDNARGVNTAGGERRMGHLCAVQRASRSADGTAMHIRMDGPGLDGMDVLSGSAPKLQFTIFVPTAEFFRAMRVSQASLDLAEQYGIKPVDNGIERFITATRRQNFLVPPRRHRAFPLAELG